MAHSGFPHQPTLRRLLSSEALSEALVVSGEDRLDRTVMQVVTSLSPAPRAGSLVVAKAGALGNLEAAEISQLAGLAVIKPYVVPAESAGMPSQHGLFGSSALASVGLDVELQRLAKLCLEAEIPLIVIPGFGDASQSADDVRLAFLGELKLAATRMHAHLISLAISAGMSGLIEELFTWVNRPLVIETVDFKVIASKNMGPTPVSQQRALTEELAEEINRLLRSQEEYGLPDLALRPFKVGRRLVFPIIHADGVVGYLSATVRPTDDIDIISEFMIPAALACMVDFSQRSKEVSTFTATQQSLLKDLLSGRSLSATDQERLDRHFSFDLCDGLLVFAVQIVTEQNQLAKGVQWPTEPCVSTEIEGTRVFVVPYDRKSGRTWQQESENLIGLLRKTVPELKVQLGAGRITETTLDLPESYREARQALIIGSMVHGDQEFAVSYGDLGVKRLLYLVFDHPELDRFYEENLAPLESYDAEWESELVPTLAVYLKEGANLNSAARALFIHRHTLRYRLEQIADILKVDIDSQEVLLNLQIAFMIKDMKGKSPA
jgi:sugar diacid utilization regulator